MIGRLNGRWIVAAAFAAVALPVTVLSVMQPWQSAAPDGAAASQPPASADFADGPAPYCCWDDAEWRGEGASDQIDFSDPSSGGIIPLMRVEGRWQERLSPNLRVRDLAARDGAPYARISVELIAALEDVIVSTDAAIHVVSGYRHPARNAMPEIGGASESQHMAGRAADIMSPDMAPIDLAAHILDVLGCRIGLGLGPDFVHMDVRGRRSAWASEDAAMTSDEFRQWVGVQCGDAMAEEPVDEEPDVDAIIAQYEPDLAELAYRLMESGVEGGVALDLRTEEPLLYAVPAGTPDAVGLGLQPLIETAVQGRVFAFACIVDDEEVVRGFMRY